MAAANIASTGIVLEALTRDNYLNWSTLVQNYLMGKDLWVNIVVEGDSRQFNDPDGRIWESKNRKALHAIQLSCGSQTLGQIRNCKTAKDAWNHLRAVFSEDLRADVHDIEQGHVQNDRLALLHSAVKKGSWNEAKSIINHGNRDIISQKSLSNGWTALHVAVDAGQEQIMKELVKIGALLTEQDWEGYTPLALAAKSTDDEKIAEWMVSTGGEDLLTSKIRAYDDKGDIPVIHAAAKGHKEMTRWLFSKTCWTNSFNLLDDTGHYRAKLLSHCIHAEIFDVAATLLQYHDDDCTQLPLNYESDQCTRPMYGLAHIPTAFPSGTGFNCCQQSFYNILSLPASIDITEGKRIDIESHDGGSNTHPLAGKICRWVKSLGGTIIKFCPTVSYCVRLFGQLGWFLQTQLLLKLPSIKKIYNIKLNHCLVREILKCFCKRIKNMSSESELHHWSVHDAMLQAAKYGITEFIESMMKANLNLLWAMDKNKRGIFAHAILNRQEKVFKLIYEIEGRKRLVTSIDVFGNNLLHLVAELGPSSGLGHRSNAALQMQRELQWFKEVESIVPPMCKEAKNADGIKPHELFTKSHERLVKDGRQWAKDTASSFTIVGTLIITIMFAAAFTLPGGNNNNGFPMFLGKNYFSYFIIADTLSLIASLSSVLMFIGILTSRYSEKDFLTTLPIKFLFGLFTIFMSVVFMMCAFCVALALMLNGHHGIVIAAIALAIISILVFTLSLLRLFFEVFIYTVKSYPISWYKRKKNLSIGQMLTNFDWWWLMML